MSRIIWSAANSPGRWTRSITRLIHRILDNSWGIHGRIASREQVQISLGFPQHQGWVELFMGWWEYAIRSWRKRAKPDAVLTFLCELGPAALRHHRA